MQSTPVCSTLHYGIHPWMGFTLGISNRWIQELRVILGKIGFEVIEPAIKNRIKETFPLHESIEN